MLGGLREDYFRNDGLLIIINYFNHRTTLVPSIKALSSASVKTEEIGRRLKIFMKSIELKLSIISHTEQYAMSRRLGYEKRETAIIFKDIADNFLKKSYENIKKNKEWLERLQKKHQKIKGAFEMQSSNSSDALLMNIFCNPNLKSWKEISDLFRVNEIKPKFGIKPGVPLKNDRIDMRTEIDLVFENIFVEAKLTENDFTQADLEKVQN